MKIDITKLLTNYIDLIEINDEVNIPKSLLTNTLITDLKNINFTGDLTLNEEDKIALTGTITGTMILQDDLTLEPVEHQFMTNLEEILEKTQNTLDITEVLWQNILVEIPSKVRSTDGDINLEGDGWRVITEEQFIKERSNSNNPFANLDKLLDTKEDR